MAVEGDQFRICNESAKDHLLSQTQGLNLLEYLFKQPSLFPGDNELEFRIFLLE